MISLQPINKRIRETLHKKSQAVSRDFTGTELDPIDQIRETYAKTTWVKMYSPVDNSEAGGLNTVSIVNGILDNQTDDGIQSMFSGFDSLYRQGEDGGGPLAPQKSETVKTHRPIPGIKDVTIDYEGGLAAIRKATINWTCWTFEDIDALQCHFMAHGKGVLLEWGWSVPTSTNELLVNEEDMKNGRAYTLIQDKVIANAGNYDAMAGIISNWEWTLRDDGGFDITTTLTSRGVNILKGDTSPPGTKVVNDEGIVQPPLHIFVGGLRETLFDLTLVGATWFDATKHKPLSEWNGSWETGSVKQPPGILSWAADNIFSNISAGPWVTWGWLEDNILSRFLGLVQKNGKPISSFRSIEPVLSDDGSGQYIPNSGDPVDNPYQAKFRSVIIRNNEWLRTPSFNRWILPGQFPAGKLEKSMFEGLIADYGDFIMKVCKGAFSDGGEVGETYFRNFAVDPNDLNKGGYLRNILISYDLIEEAFLDATNVREGMSNLFDEFNKDLDGYWNFEIVADSQNPGNIKVVDMNKTHMTVSDLIGRRNEGNPDSPLFVFPSWGEKSIVKNQSLNSKVPSAMAVTAMYAGTSKEGHEEAATPAGRALAAITAKKTAKDISQEAIKHANRVGEKEPFGSISPYGDIDDPSLGVVGVEFSSDGSKDTAIPSGETFGHNKGVAFKLDREALIKYYKDQIKTKADKAADASDAEKKAAQEAAKITAAIAKEKASTDKSRKMFEDMIELPAGVTSEEKSKYWPWNWADKVTFSLYNREGDLEEVPEYHVFIRETMIDYIHGNTVPIGKEGKEDKAKILAETVPDPGIALELEITIDGTGGIIPGNCFQVDYIPETFKKFVVFQAIKVGHSISSDNWTTTISGPMRVAMDRIKKED